jgi:hypothetical protein
MDLSDPVSLLSGLFIGLVGMGFFMYGKKAGSFRGIIAGIVLSVIPMVVSVVWAEWAAAAACIGAFVLAAKFD